MLAQDALQVLVVEPASNDIEAILNSIRQGGAAIYSQSIADGPQLLSALREQAWDVVLCATDATDLTLQEVCAGLADSNADLALIVVYDGRAETGDRRVVESLRMGAADAVDKHNPDHLELVLGREIAHLTERRSVRQWRSALDERERHWQGLLEASRDPIAYVHGGMHIHANPTYLDMFGYDSLEELESLPMLDLVDTGDQARFKKFIRDEQSTDGGTRAIELAGLRSDGNRLDVRIEISPDTFEGESCWQVVIRDQTDSTEIYHQLEYLRRHDPLTGLSNRQHFVECLESGMKLAPEREGDVRALLYVELDNFHTLRETAGIAGSDQIITEIAKLFRERVADRHDLARFGDNMFTILVEVPNVRGAMDIAERLRSGLDERVIEVGGASFGSTCSVGICPISINARSPESVLAEAHRLARVARKMGGNRVEVLLSEEVEATRRRFRRSSKPTLEVALEGGDLRLLYQPIINLRETSMELYEVSLGRIGKTGEVVVADNLFDVELEAELLKRVDEWVIENAINVLAEQIRTDRDTHFFITLSDQALYDEQMLLAIGKKLRMEQVPSDHLILEISETTAVSQARSVKAFIKGLREFNCLAALQDFGTGLNSLNTLKSLDVAYFKIDPVLVQTLAVNPESESAVRSIVETAMSLDKRAIAAGVEEAATLAMLWDIGVHYAQGDGIRAPGSELEWDFEASEIEE